jgi:hypothetical protein
VPLGADHLTAYRTFTKTREPLGLQPFRGSVAKRVDHLRQLVFPALTGRVSTDQIAQFRAQYLRRVTTVTDELGLLPSGEAEVARLRSSLDLAARFLQGER